MFYNVGVVDVKVWQSFTLEVKDIHLELNLLLYLIYRQTINSE